MNKLDTIWQRNVAVAAATASNVTESFPAAQFEQIALYATCGAITGGTTPDITLSLEGLVGTTWFTLDTLATFDAAGESDSTSLTVLAEAVRVRWVFAGAVPATSIKFSATLIGR